jgi:hypothetical protein
MRPEPGAMRPEPVEGPAEPTEKTNTDQPDADSGQQ